METYKNSYTENEDKILWALHEIRHELHKERKNKTIDEINSEALKIYSDWLNERDKKTAVTDTYKRFTARPFNLGHDIHADRDIIYAERGF